MLEENGPSGSNQQPESSEEPKRMASGLDTVLLELRDIVKEEFTVTHVYVDPRDNIPRFIIEKDAQIKERSARLAERLKPYKVLAAFRRMEIFEGTGEYETVIILVPAPPPRKKGSYRVSLALFIATVVTVLIAGWSFASSPAQLFVLGFPSNPFPIIVITFLYAAAILSIIGIHELGHVFSSHSHGMETSLPYFIPGLFYGTFGAVILQRTPPPTRDSLFDLGISGPVVGFLIACVAVVVGLMLSPPVTPELQSYLATLGLGLSSIPDPLLITFITDLMGISGSVLAHPIFIAGWLGFIITGLNYCPIGQLDGGHVSRALFGHKYHKIVSYIAVFILILAGQIFMAIIAFFLFYGRHPGPIDDVSPLSTGRKIVGLLSFLLPILLIPPVTIF
ncbi:MAG: site-2 protease family protein [Promethearchaeota archaeon]